jgi:hypothetical protein
MPDKPGGSASIMSWLVVGLSVVLLVWGSVWYGWSSEVQHRFWTDIFDRTRGPMTFRFYLQPVMAFIAALHDGIRDARFGHKSFFWTVAFDPTRRGGRLREGVASTARIVLLGLSMDVIYQIRVLHSFYPAEALLMAILLAVVPYFALRWIVEGVSRWWLSRRRTGSEARLGR